MTGERSAYGTPESLNNGAAQVTDENTRCIALGICFKCVKNERYSHSESYAPTYCALYCVK